MQLHTDSKRQARLFGRLPLHVEVDSSRRGKSERGVKKRSLELTERPQYRGAGGVCLASFV